MLILLAVDWCVPAPDCPSRRITQALSDLCPPCCSNDNGDADPVTARACSAYITPFLYEIESIAFQGVEDSMSLRRSVCTRVARGKGKWRLSLSRLFSLYISVCVFVCACVFGTPACSLQEFIDVNRLRHPESLFSYFLHYNSGDEDEL